MNKQRWCLCVAVGFALASQLLAEDKPVVREIFVPYDDLNVILEGDANRVFLSRQEYEDLLAKAKIKAAETFPIPGAILRAEYEGTLSEGRAAIRGVLELELLQEELAPLPLDFGGVGIRQARLDGKPAALGRTPAGAVQLFVSGKGKHRLELELTAPLATSAAQQTLAFRLPTPAAATLKLTVPGNVEVKAGAEVAARAYNMAANRTEFQLLLRPGDQTIVTSLNNRQVQERRVVVARSVLIDEVTEGYERLHANVSCRVLQGAADKLQFVLPKDFEVTSVVSTGLARWEVEPGEDRQLVTITLREATSEAVVLELLATRPPVLKNWKFPQLEVVEAAGQVAVLGLLVEDRLQPQNIAAEGLLPLDAGALAQALPPSVTNPEKGAPGVRQVVTYYAPSNDYALTADFVKTPADLHLTSNSLLVVGERELTLRGGFALTPKSETRFEIRFHVPTPWKVTEVTLADGTKLPFERFSEGKGAERLVVKIARGLPPGSASVINYTAVATPNGWLGNWKEKSISFPVFTVEAATSAEGGLAIHSQDDLIVQPEKLENLTPLLENEKREFGFGELATSFAFRYDTLPYSATVKVERVVPLMTAQTISMLRVERDHLAAHYELDYSIEGARTSRLTFSLPLDTPKEINVQALGGPGRSLAVVKELTSEETKERRWWRITLADRASGRVTLAVDFTRRTEQAEPKNMVLPLARAEEVEYQTGLIAVEGSAELEVAIQKNDALRTVDVGELAAAEQPVGRRVVGTFGYVGIEPTIKIDVRQGEEHPLPLALVERAELVTQFDAAGRSVTAARWLVRSNIGFLEVRLPAGASLWTMLLDGQSTRPQQQPSGSEPEHSLLLDLGASAGVSDVQVVFSAAGSPLGFAGKLDLQAPKLFVHEARGSTPREVTVVDLQWHLLLPTGYRVLKSEGTVYPDQPLESLRYHPALTTVALLYEVAGGIGAWNDRLPTTKYAAVATTSAPKSATTELSYEYRSAVPPPAAMPGVMPPATAESFERLADESKSMPALDSLAPVRSKAEGMPQAAEPSVSASVSGGSPQPQHADIAAINGPTGGTRPASPATPQPRAKARQGDYWALEGIGTLPISITPEPGAQGQYFRSYGADPELDVTLVNGRRIQAAAWATGLLALLLGLHLTCRPVKHRATYVLILLLLGAVPPLVTNALDPALPVFDAVFFAGAALIAWYLIAGTGLAFVKRFPRLVGMLPACATRPLTAALLLAFVLAGTASSSAQSPADELAPGPPVKVPANAVIVPYDAKDEEGLSKAEKVLVPYETYVELWNRAFPEKKLRDPKLPTPYALAGAAWQGTLGTSEQLTLQGAIEIDVFDAQPVQIPFALSGCVLETAMLDGKPARVQLIQPDAPPAQAAAAAPGALAAGQTMLLVHAHGQGRKTLTLMVRVPLTQQGGWRVVDARIPVAPAASLTLTVPQAQTEIRVTGTADRAAYETTEANEKLETVLTPEGTLSLRWRPRVTEGAVDADLVAQSRAVFDVREDALRMTWQLRCEFRRGSRDSFTLYVPQEYMVDQVFGTNVKAWKATAEGDRQAVEVTLLKAATGSETFGIYLSRRGKVGAEDLARFAVPVVEVAAAALSQGELLIRRSPRLEIETVGNPTLARIDPTGELHALAQETDRTDPPAIPLKAYQAWRFQGASFSLVLSAVSTRQLPNAEVRSLVAVGPRRTELYASLHVRPRGVPVYEVRAYLPESFELTSVTPTEVEWSVTKSDGRRLLTALLPIGRGEPFAIVLEGKLGKTPPAGEAAPVPVFELVGVNQQTNDVAITADPVDDLSFTGLKDAEVVPVRESFSWVQVVRQPLVKGVIRTRSPSAAASYTLTRRPTIVTARTITNVKLTKQAVLETSLLFFRIEQGSLSEIAFLLPERLKNARIDALLLRQKTVEPAKTSDGQPKPGWIRVTLQLQDEVTGDYRVAISHDRLLLVDKETIRPPFIERHPTAQQLIVIENAGRDEIQVDAADYLEELDRQQQAWRELQSELGSHILRAWRAAGAGEPKLVFHAQTRELVQTAKARIGWAELRMAIDQAGAYRAVQQYRIFNQTEQYLEVQPPAGGELWTALVAGEPVKPVASNTPGSVRIPLIKTADGDGDYLVELKYGGRIGELGAISSFTAPVIKVQNLRVEQNFVRLFLPESHQWLSFDGSLRQVADSGTVAAGFQTYFNKQIAETRRQLSSENLNTRLRAANNLKQLSLGIQNFHSSYSDYAPSSKDWKLAEEQLSRNSAELNELNRQVEAAPMIPQGVEGDNRDRLNDLFRAQSLNRAKGNAIQYGNNFSAPQDFDKPQAAPATQHFNPKWYEGNKLAQLDGKAVDGRKTDGEMRDGPASGKKANGAREDFSGGSFQSSRFSRGRDLQKRSGAEMPARKPAQYLDEAAKPGGKLPQIANEREQRELVEELGKQQGQQQLAKGLKDRELENSTRYQQRLEAQNPGANPPAEQAGASALGLNSGVQLGGSGLGSVRGDLANAQPTDAARRYALAAGRPAMGQGGGEAKGRAPQADPNAAVQFTSPEEGEEGLLLGGYRSLDVPLPARGQAYYFMTVGSDVTLTARGISTSRLERLGGLALIALILGGLWFVTRGNRLNQLGAILRTTPALVSVLVVCVALFWLGVLPLFTLLGAIATASALVAQAVGRRQSRNAAAAA